MGKLYFLFHFLDLISKPIFVRERNDFARVTDWYPDVDWSWSSKLVEKKKCGKGRLLVGRCTSENVHLTILRERILIRRQSPLKRRRENVHQPRFSFSWCARSKKCVGILQSGCHDFFPPNSRSNVEFPRAFWRIFVDFRKVSSKKEQRPSLLESIFGKVGVWPRSVPIFIHRFCLGTAFLGGFVWCVSGPCLIASTAKLSLSSLTQTNGPKSQPSEKLDFIRQGVKWRDGEVVSVSQDVVFPKQRRRFWSAGATPNKEKWHSASVFPRLLMLVGRYLTFACVYET